MEMRWDLHRLFKVAVWILKDRLPISLLCVCSVKECYYMRGTYSTAGLLRFYEARNTLDSPAVLTVRHLGANPFCKTNVPQVVFSPIDLFI
jgi:hypothetical protein